MKVGQLALRVLGSLLFPQECALCGEWTSNDDWSPLCEPCRRSFRPFDSRICHFCGIPAPGDVLQSFSICGPCARRPRPYDCARAWGPYEGPLRKAVRRFKFDGMTRLSAPFSDMMAERLVQARLGMDFDWIVPVPTHPKRKRARGFDHVGLLARGLSRRLRIPVFRGLRRVRHTAPQFGLDRADRRLNLKGAFAVGHPRSLREANLLLIDDVMTSGATVEEASRALRRRGRPAAVAVLVLARPRLGWGANSPT